MKSQLLLSSLLFCFVITACGQSLKESDVPAAVKSGFEKQFPGSRAKWEKEEGNYEASFKKDSKEISVVISSTGTILETETEIALAELPAAASKISESE
jgi:hypothetical protein